MTVPIVGTAVSLQAGGKRVFVRLLLEEERFYSSVWIGLLLPAIAEQRAATQINGLLGTEHERGGHKTEMYFCASPQRRQTADIGQLSLCGIKASLKVETFY